MSGRPSVRTCIFVFVFYYCLTQFAVLPLFQSRPHVHCPVTTSTDEIDTPSLFRRNFSLKIRPYSSVNTPPPLLSRPTPLVVYVSWTLSFLGRAY